MFRLMKSEKLPLDRVNSGSVSSCRQIQVTQFQRFNTALIACGVANGNGESFHYILNESGKEYYGGTWID
jgi:hypothetical protein